MGLAIMLRGAPSAQGRRGDTGQGVENEAMGTMERDELAEQRALVQFLGQIENYTPAIPDAVTNYYLKQAGFDCPDERVVRLVSLAAQKFIADVANDALQQQKKNQAVLQQQSKRPLPKDRKYVLTTEDLSYALSQQGIHVRKPTFFN